MTEKTGIFLDDIRTVSKTPSAIEEWKIVRSYEEFQNAILLYVDLYGVLPPIISFDHDLHEEHYTFYFSNPRGTKPPYESFQHQTGMHCLVWLVKFCEKENIPLDSNFVIHSHNAPCVNAMEKYLNFFKKEQGVDRPTLTMNWEYDDMVEESEGWEAYQTFLNVKNKFKQ